jgi:hypothetical protein
MGLFYWPSLPGEKIIVGEVAGSGDADKRAVFVDHNSIRFTETDPRNEAARSRSAAEYNAVNRTMTRKELANIPLVRPGKALKEAMTKRSQTPRRSVAGRSVPVRVIVSTTAVQ